ncbi:hypothetical protein [Streptomyces sp. Amel2xC10]|uniref:hypothetical protein n=1 Tax=Streptomyces sp. Amel2xC10 TaxID=1305826 RepID=UPI0011803261|nr:hypothetical protein [Streptomyces sp. Amel2xC10]
MTFGKPFVLRRDRDLSGVSGTGIVADGVLFPDGQAAIHWRGKWALTTPHPDGIASIIDIHDHGGRGDLHIIWADEFEAARRELMVGIVDAFDVPPEICGTEAEAAYRTEQVRQALRDASGSAVQSWEYRDWEINGRLGALVEAVMPIVGEVLKERDRLRIGWRNRLGRAYALAHRWEGAHGASMFLVRAAGTELREALDDSGAGYGDVVHSGPEPQAADLPGVDEAAPCAAYEPPIDPEDTGFCARCGMFDFKHHAAQTPVGVDTHGRDTAVAGHVVDAAEPQHDRPMNGCSNPDHACPGCGNCANNHPGEGGCPDTTPDRTLDSHADKIRSSIPNHQVNGGEEPDSKPDTVTDPQWLRRRYAEALAAEHLKRAKEQIVASPGEHSAAMAAAVMRVRDDEMTRLLARLRLAEASLGAHAELDSAAAAAGSYAHRAEEAEAAVARVRDDEPANPGRASWACTCQHRTPARRTDAPKEDGHA